MQTVFSYIVQKRFSQVNEDVATDALTFILHTSEAARDGMMKLLRGIVTDMPDLQFRTQQTEGNLRPDMGGFDGAEPRVFIENKFWAGLTDNQPVSYVKQLANYSQPAILLVVVPAEREQTVWRELTRRLADAEISISPHEGSSGVMHSVATGSGPVMALTSWEKLLSLLLLEVDDPQTMSDLLQLRALCNAADSQAFVPLTAVVVSDQRTPRLIQSLSAIIQAATEVAVTEGVVNIGSLRPQAGWNRIGRYLWLNGQNGVGAWLGVHFDLWGQHGITPVWLYFDSGAFGHALEVRPLIEPWAAKKGIFTTTENGNFAIAIELALSEEKDAVAKSIADRLREIGDVLSALPK